MAKQHLQYSLRAETEALTVCLNYCPRQCLWSSGQPSADVREPGADVMQPSADVMKLHADVMKPEACFTETV